MSTKTLHSALVSAVLLGMSYTANAEIRLPEIISDHMVLQQNGSAKLWGEATANTKVTVKTSWSKTRYSSTADADGKWVISIDTPKGSYDTHSVTISDKDGSVTLNDILIGEVWLCGGQSNMEMPLEGFEACPIEEGDREIAVSGNYRDRIRRVKVPKTGSEEVQEYVKGSWETPCPANTRYWTATGWFFAKMVNEVLNVPVGLLECNWGGSAVESWLPREIVYSYPENTLPNGKYSPGMLPEGYYRWDTPIVMYNAMLYPVRNYTIKGFLWYQGETNAGFPQYYAERLATMVKVWRELWGQGDIPFFEVELAPYIYGGDGTSGARIREAQRNAVKLIPNSGIISTNDLVYGHEYDQVHPRKKRPVGERLAYMALNKAYGYADIICEGPVYKEIQINGNQVDVYFDNTVLGLSPWHGITGFELAGEDRVFYPAKADLIHWDKSIVTVTCEQVPNPVAVRYCFKDFLVGNLTGRCNVPIPPFRSDNWD